MNTQPLTECQCSKCSLRALSILGKQHRRCPGPVAAPPRDKHDKLPSSHRGVWQTPSKEET